MRKENKKYLPALYQSLLHYQGGLEKGHRLNEMLKRGSVWIITPLSFVYRLFKVQLKLFVTEVNSKKYGLRPKSRGLEKQNIDIALNILLSCLSFALSAYFSLFTNHTSTAEKNNFWNRLHITQTCLEYYSDTGSKEYDLYKLKENEDFYLFIVNKKSSFEICSCPVNYGSWMFRLHVNQHTLSDEHCW